MAGADQSELDTIRFQALLLDSVGQAVIATDVGGIVLYWNSAAERLYGWTAQAAVGLPIVELISAPQSVEEATLIFAELAAGRSWTGEIIVHARDGRAFPAHVTDTPVFGADGTLQAIIGISTDVTERKRDEQAVRHLSAIVESSSDAIIGKTLDGTIISWNGGAERLYGNAAAQVIGQRAYGYWHPTKSPKKRSLTSCAGSRRDSGFRVWRPSDATWTAASFTSRSRSRPSTTTGP